MTDRSPIIDVLADADDDAARGEWLLTCPLIFFISEYEVIRTVLLKAGFAAGLDYIGAERAALMATRQARTGEERFDVRMSQRLARGDLNISIRTTSSTDRTGEAAL
jgi:hypothetical protein